MQGHAGFFLTTLNAPYGVALYNLPQGGDGSTPQLFTTMSGLPLGTVGGNSDGEIAVKVLQVGSTVPGFAIPTYDNIDIAYYGTTNNIQTVTYSLAGQPVKNLTMTYAGGGAADDDLLTNIVAA